MSFLSSALASVGASLLGKTVSAGASYLFGALPQGAQSFLKSAGSFLGIGSRDVGNMTEEAAKAFFDRKAEIRGRKGPTPNMIGVSVGDAQTGRLQKAGQAQMLPLGSTDRVSRALDDARVAEKIMRMAGQAPIPNPNLRMGQTISLSSATTPKTSLTKKFSK